MNINIVRLVDFLLYAIFEILLQEVFLFLSHNLCEKFLDIGYIRLHLGKLRISFIRFPIFVIKQNFHYDYLVLQIDVHLVSSTGHSEY